MKVAILAIALLFISALAQNQCPIPPNCETYSASQNLCIACRPNYLLIANNCYNTLTSAPTTNPISSDQQSGVVLQTPSPQQLVTNSLPVVFTLPPSSSQSNSNVVNSQQSSSLQGGSAPFFIPLYNGQGIGGSSQSSQQTYSFTSSSNQALNTNGGGSYSSSGDFNCKIYDEPKNICA